MFYEGFEILIGSAAVFAAEAGDFFGVGSVDSGDFDPGDGASSAGVRLRDVAAADESDVESHEEFFLLLVLEEKNSWDFGFLQMIR
jgi:hypothetical protein